MYSLNKVGNLGVEFNWLWAKPPEGAIFRLGLNRVKDGNHIPLKYTVIPGALA